jgi:small subunit ribosomal protein S18
MPQRRDKKGPSAKDRRPIKKKTSILNSENIAWIDYKDVNLLRRFMSERAKIRARRVTGNDQQQQAAVAKAIKLAREMALLPYSVRQVTQRSKGRRDRGDRGDRGELRMPTAPSETPEAQLENGAEAIEQVEGIETPETNGSGDVEATLAADGGEGGEGGEE